MAVPAGCGRARDGAAAPRDADVSAPAGPDGAGAPRADAPPRTDVYAPDAGRARCESTLLFKPDETPISAYTDTSECGLDATGAMTFTYDFEVCPIPSPGYAGCTLVAAQTLDVFDADHGASGIVEATFCVDRRIVGALNVWYYRSPYKRYLRLLAPGEVMQPGCRTRFFVPDDACLPDWESLPASCRNVCGKTSGCPRSASEAEIQLVAEWCTEPTGGTVTLRPMKLHAAGCACLADGECPAGRRCDLAAALPDPRCRPDARCAGVCVER